MAETENTENQKDSSLNSEQPAQKPQETSQKAPPLPPSVPSTEAVFTQDDEREAIFDVPVKITAVVGDVKMPVRDLVRLGRGAVVSLNKKLGSAIDIYANGRLIARGEITIIEDDNIAVTMTDIISSPIDEA